MKKLLNICFRVETEDLICLSGPSRLRFCIILQHDYFLFPSWRNEVTNVLCLIWQFQHFKPRQNSLPFPGRISLKQSTCPNWSDESGANKLDDGFIFLQTGFPVVSGATFEDWAGLRMWWLLIWPRCFVVTLLTITSCWVGIEPLRERWGLRTWHLSSSEHPVCRTFLVRTTDEKLPDLTCFDGKPLCFEVYYGKILLTDGMSQVLQPQAVCIHLLQKLAKTSFCVG